MDVLSIRVGYIASRYARKDNKLIDHKNLSNIIIPHTYTKYWKNISLLQVDNYNRSFMAHFTNRAFIFYSDSRCRYLYSAGEEYDRMDYRFDELAKGNLYAIGTDTEIAKLKLSI